MIDYKSLRRLSVASMPYRVVKFDPTTKKTKTMPGGFPSVDEAFGHCDTKGMNNDLHHIYVTTKEGHLKHVRNGNGGLNKNGAPQTIQVRVAAGYDETADKKKEPQYTHNQFAYVNNYLPKHRDHHGETHRGSTTYEYHHPEAVNDSHHEKLAKHLREHGYSRDRAHKFYHRKGYSHQVHLIDGTHANPDGHTLRFTFYDKHDTHKMHDL